MEKIFKKSLALVLSAALCLTALVGCLTVSAEGASATVTVGSVEVNSDATTATVPVTITATGDGIAAAMFELKVDTTKINLSGLWEDIATNIKTESDSIGINVSVSNDGDNVTTVASEDVYRFIVEGVDPTSGENVSIKQFTNASFDLTFNIASGVTGENAIEFVNDTHAQACNAGTFNIETGKYDGSDEALVPLTGTNGKVTVKAASTEPVWNDSLKDKIYSLRMFISNTFGFEFTVYLNNVDYDDFELVVSKKEFNAQYAYTGNNIVTTFKKSDCRSDSYPNMHLYYFNYSGIAMYEMSLDITYSLYIIKDGVKVSYYTYDPATLSQKANTYYTENASNATKKAFAVDLLNLGTAAQVYFANKNGTDANTPLKDFALPNAAITGETGTDYGTLTEIEGTRDPAITTQLQLLTSPSFWYTINLSTAGYKTPADLTFTASYYSKATSETISRVVNGSDLTEDEGRYGSYGLYYFGFPNVALYDSDKVVTLTIAATDGTTWTHEYSVESFLSTVVNTATGQQGDLYKAVASFTASCHNFWPDY